MEAILFPGQGAQRRGMGRDLFRYYPGLTDLASEIIGCDLELLCTEDPDGLLVRSEFTQPAMFAVNAFHYFERMHAGAKAPSVALGHSMGEYNALLAADVFDFETGLGLVRKRGELMSAAPAGGMFAVLGLALAEIRHILAEEGLTTLDVANHNTPRQHVLSGPKAEIVAGQRVFERYGAAVVPLEVSAAFHSRQMRSVRTEFAKVLAQVAFAPPAFPVIANVTAAPYALAAVAETLAAQIDGPVLWTDSVLAVLERDPEVTFIEMQGETLSRMVAEIRSLAPAAAGRFGPPGATEPRPAGLMRPPPAGNGMAAEREIEPRLRSFVEETFLFEFDEEVGTDSDLFAAGIIDSYGYMKLINFLESELQVAVTEEELLSNVMVSFDAVVAFVRAKTRAPVDAHG